MMEKTCVWWDIDNCAVPKGCDANVIAKNISSALADGNYCGPVSITAYGDTHRIPASVQHALTSTGVSLRHVPAGVKDASDKKILVGMLLWAVENPPPANYFLISGDRDFSDALHQLRMMRYNILLAQPQKASAPLVAAAKTVWLWTTLVAGGPPLVGGELEQFASNGHSSLSDSQQIPVPDPIQTQRAVNSRAVHQSRTRKSPSTTTGNGVKHKGKAFILKRKLRGKTTQKKMTQASRTKASTMSGLTSSKVGEASVAGAVNSSADHKPGTKNSPSTTTGTGVKNKVEAKQKNMTQASGTKASTMSGLTSFKVGEASVAGAVNSSADPKSGTRKSRSTRSTTTGKGVKHKSKATQKNMTQASGSKASTMSGLTSSKVGNASVAGAVNSSADHKSGTGKSPSMTTGNGVKHKGKATQKNMTQASGTKASTMSGLTSSKVGKASVAGAVNSSASHKSGTGKSPSMTTGHGVKHKGKATQKNTTQASGTKASTMSGKTSSKVGKASVARAVNSSADHKSGTKKSRSTTTGKGVKHKG